MIHTNFVTWLSSSLNQFVSELFWPLACSSYMCNHYFFLSFFSVQIVNSLCWLPWQMPHQCFQCFDFIDIFKCVFCVVNCVVMGQNYKNERFRLTLSQTTNFGLFQTERVCRQQFQFWWKRKESSLNGQKTLWEKEKLLVTSNFSFPHSMFKRLLLQTRKNQGLFGKGLKESFQHTAPTLPCHHRTLYMPSWATPTPRGVPIWFTWLSSFP